MDTEVVKTIIDTQVTITGTIKSSASIRIDGKLEGDLICEADAVIGQEAIITGNMEVNSISVEGTINGNITAKDRLEMKSTAHITGDVKSKRLTVEDGVTFTGRSEVTPGSTPTSTPATPAQPTPQPVTPVSPAKPTIPVTPASVKPTGDFSTKNEGPKGSFFGKK